MAKMTDSDGNVAGLTGDQRYFYFLDRFYQEHLRRPFAVRALALYQLLLYHFRRAAVERLLHTQGRPTKGSSEVWRAVNDAESAEAGTVQPGWGALSAWFAADNAILLMGLHTTKLQTLTAARRELTGRGWLAYRPGGKCRSALYSLCLPDVSGSVTEQPAEDRGAAAERLAEDRGAAAEGSPEMPGPVTEQPAEDRGAAAERLAGDRGAAAERLAEDGGATAKGSPEMFCSVAKGSTKTSAAMAEGLPERYGSVAKGTPEIADPAAERSADASPAAILPQKQALSVTDPQAYSIPLTQKHININKKNTYGFHSFSVFKDQEQKKDKQIYGEFQNVLLTDWELGELKRRFSDWTERIDLLSAYIASKGDGYQSHYATILCWAKRERINHRPRQKSAATSFSNFEQRKTSYADLEEEAFLELHGLLDGKDGI